MALRDRRFAGFKFRRQAIIGFRIVDLFCPARGLVIELDGNTHDLDIDRRRDAIMARTFGFETMRFTNFEIMSNMDGVPIVLLHKLTAQPDRWPGRPATTPSPSSEEDGGI